MTKHFAPENRVLSGRAYQTLDMRNRGSDLLNDCGTVLYPTAMDSLDGLGVSFSIKVRLPTVN